jgi:putative flavoprotein involved in K+ transport
MTRAATSPATEVDRWLARFSEALAGGDPGAASELFGDDGLWRDLVAFTWNIKTVEGPDGVRDLLEHTLAATRPGGWRTTEAPTEDDGVVSAWLAFETRAGRGYAHLRLKEGRAWTLVTALHELKGHEEPLRDGRPRGVEHGADPARVRTRSSATRSSPRC